MVGFGKHFIGSHRSTFSEGIREMRFKLHKDDPKFDMVCLNVFMGEYPVNCYLLRCKATGETAVVDTGANPKKIISKAHEMGVRPSMVLLTHAHPDHADGCDPIAARWPAAAFRKMPWPERDSRQSVEFRSIADGDLVPAGSGVLRAVHTPGHAPDHLCFFDETDGTLFSADLVILGSSVVIPSSRGGSLALYLDSLRRILDEQDFKGIPKRISPTPAPEKT